MKDKKLENLIKKEIKRQNETIDLIASENYASQDILDVLGSPLVNKYSEGYPGKRYYPGNEFYDQIENLAKERALKTFRLSSDEWSANVQPYSGSPANLAVYLALLKPGDLIIGMSLSAGGHLTHGHRVSASGIFFNSIQYGVDKNGFIDYEEVLALAKKHKPKIIVSGTTAYPRKLDFKKFGEIAKQTGAYHLADISHISGLVAAGLHQSPFKYCDAVMTTTHKTLRGPRGAIIFARNSNLKSQISNLTIADAVDKAVFPGIQGGPHNNVIAAKALMFFEAFQSKFKSYQKQIVKNAKVLSDSLMKYGFNLVTGGTDTHLMLIDVRNFGIDGKTAEKMLEENSIIANRNSVPGDISPFKPSGIRIGTPAATTRGMKEKEMRRIAELVYLCLVKKQSIKIEVIKLCRKFPLFYKKLI